MRRDDGLETVATTESVTEIRAIAAEMRRTIRASQAVLDLCAATESPPAERIEESCDRSDALGEVGDALIRAHAAAKQDGDPLTLTLIERALFHVGRRLARGLSPVEIGLFRH